MVIIIFVFKDSILKMLGASADTFGYAKEYLSIVTVAGPFVLISNCYANIIRSEGTAGSRCFASDIGCNPVSDCVTENFRLFMKNAAGEIVYT